MAFIWFLLFHHHILQCYHYYHHKKNNQDTFQIQVQKIYFNCSRCECFPKTTLWHSGQVAGVECLDFKGSLLLRQGWVSMLCLGSIPPPLPATPPPPALPPPPTPRPQILQRSSPASTTPTAARQVTLMQESRPQMCSILSKLFDKLEVREWEIWLTGKNVF